MDSGEAPRDRDWVADSDTAAAEVYFKSLEAALSARTHLGHEFPALWTSEPEVVPEQDWNAQWKAHFLSESGGFTAPPFWRVIPVESAESTSGTGPYRGERVLKIVPGAGFGTGTHETTQLCLELLSRPGVIQHGSRVLDFGSGSGILAIAAALLGAASVHGVEIDELAIENARTNAELNGVGGAIRSATTLGAFGPEKYSVVIANILRPVLVQFAPELCARTEEVLVLSGLIESDVEPVREVYVRELERYWKRSPVTHVLNKGQWWAIQFLRFAAP